MIEIYSKPACPYCVKAKALCEQNGYEFKYYMLDEDFTREKKKKKFPTARTFPQITVDGESIGGFDQLQKWHDTDWNEK